VNGEGATRVPPQDIHFDHIEGEALVIALGHLRLAVFDRRGVLVRAIEPSHVANSDGIAA